MKVTEDRNETFASWGASATTTISCSPWPLALFVGSQPGVAFAAAFA